MKLRPPKHSPALLCALTAPFLYAAVNLISLQIAGRPNASPPWDPWWPGETERAIESAQTATYVFTFLLLIQAIFIALLDQPSRRATVKDIVIFTMAGVGYLLTLAGGIVLGPITQFWAANDFHRLEEIVPGWYMLGLICIAAVTFIGLVIWTFTRALELRQPERTRSASMSVIHPSEKRLRE